MASASSSVFINSNTALAHYPETSAGTNESTMSNGLSKCCGEPSPVYKRHSKGFESLESQVRTVLASRGRPVPLDELASRPSAEGLETTALELRRLTQVSREIAISVTAVIGIAETSLHEQPDAWRDCRAGTVLRDGGVELLKCLVRPDGPSRVIHRPGSRTRSRMAEARSGWRRMRFQSASASWPTRKLPNEPKRRPTANGDVRSGSSSRLRPS
jgi:hypothetical protein